MKRIRLITGLFVLLGISFTGQAYSQIQVIRQLAGSGAGAVNQHANNLQVNYTLSQTAVDLKFNPPSAIIQGFWSFAPIFLSVETPTQVETKKVITNYPNPVNSFTTFNYRLDKASRITLKIYDITGHEVVTLVDEYQSQGEQKVSWDVKGNDGNLVPNGTYLYELNVSGNSSNAYSLRNVMVIAK